MNRRGEVATVVVVAVAAVALLIGTLAPSLNPFNRLFGAQAQEQAKQKNAWTRQDEIVTPAFVVKDGQAVIVHKVERHYDQGTQETTPKLTFGQRIGRFFAGLSTWGLIFVVVSFAFFGGTPILWLWRRYAVMKQAFKNTVAAIRETDDDTYTKLKVHLAAKHDRRDRKLVDKLKAELQ